MRRWKSDSLVVLGARESRAHGEAARQVEMLVWGNIPCTQRKEKNVHTTGPDHGKGEVKS
jgi:hypothetical protein